MNSLTKKIGLLIPEPSANASGLTGLLTGAFPGVFEVVASQKRDGLSGLIFFGAPAGLANLELPSLTLVPSEKFLDNALVQFGATDQVPAVFRKREIKQKRAVVFERVSLENGGEIIASVEGLPSWTAVKPGAIAHHTCAIGARQFETPRLLFQHLAQDEFTAFLPILDFIRRTGTEEGWVAPPLRAQVMFDDPNLHGTRYGWLDYPKLIQSAEAHGYHASFATIPLDGWMTSAKSAALVKANAARLSLLVHGNNHVWHELASFPTPEAAIAAMSQAWNRVRTLEQKTGVEISKVVAAPHGACSEQTLEVLARLGYEAACISPGSLYGHNRDKDWTKKIGVAMAEVIAGTPVMPRFRIAYDSVNAILLSAYLEQPIIPVGHHQDVSDGMKMLETVADFINSIGDIRWLDMQGISRSNYYTKVSGGKLKVRTFARVFEIQIPAGVTEMAIERPWLGKETEGIILQARGREAAVYKNYTGEALTVVPGSTLEITSVHPRKIEPLPVPGGINLMAFARRQLCECRDRLQPHFK